jgi:hypothetical protein
MKLLTAKILLSLLSASSVWCDATPSTIAPTSPFDQYGEIRWEDEKARLDNFAIQLQQAEGFVGYILVYDATGGCPGEAAARAIRAKRYLTGYRKVTWNQVIWRRDGYRKEIGTTLLITPTRSTVVPYPYSSISGPAVDGPMTRACRNKLEKIRKSRW